MLAAMIAVPSGSLTDWARHCGWTLKAQPGESPQPNKSLAQRVMKRLIDNKFVTENGRSFTFTKIGLETDKNQAATGA